MVFAYHVRNFKYFGGDTSRVVDWVFGSGTVGVSFFFILSGFILVWSARPGYGAVGFWRRRLARIYPVHLVTAALALVLAFTLVPGLRPSGSPEAVANVLLIGAWKPQWWQTLNPVSWSLVCEAFFYAAFPALYAVLRRFGSRHLIVLMVVCAATVVLLPWASLHFTFGWDPAHFPLTRFPEFVLGAAVGRLVQLGAWRGPGLPASLALVLTGFLLTHLVPGPYGYAACTVVGLACLIPAAALADLNGTPSWWRHRWLVRLGEWSFAFYMIHILVMRTGEQLFTADPRLDTAPALAAATGAFLISLLLAWTLYDRVEQPGRRWVLRGVRHQPAVHWRREPLIGSPRCALPENRRPSAGDSDKLEVMDDRRAVKISKYLAKHLRHQPERIGITLDPHGWVEIPVLLAASSAHGFPITRAELEHVVAVNDKQRYAIEGDRIRASQGHTIEVDLGLPVTRPPAYLFHGTVARSLAAIHAEGLRPMDRHHVHLSEDRETAARVGARRGKPVVLSIDAAAMHRTGHAFRVSANGVWLVDAVPPEFLRFPG